MFKAFVAGLLAGVLLLAGGVYYYFVSGMAPVAAGDPPMPYERRMANRALDAHIEKAKVLPPPIQSLSVETSYADSAYRNALCAYD